ncbi:hypothetical protein K491DRAFT_50735 [Lophiostoma macrostomum CBS 122681]|uniref:Uncharacterized protein n=1 Tax=Lophiostoma macrostomum CBS 122681 TaxID=1314788 RepID=A0A6A6T1E1_9PLEO|nr:hypothetical protein K491DRAFT_50735 [Lophiostoma macrostomum CBS 122681]
MLSQTLFKKTRRYVMSNRRTRPAMAPAFWARCQTIKPKKRIIERSDVLLPNYCADSLCQSLYEHRWQPLEPFIYFRTFLMELKGNQRCLNGVVVFLKNNQKVRLKAACGIGGTEWSSRVQKGRRSHHMLCTRLSLAPDTLNVSCEVGGVAGWQLHCGCALRWCPSVVRLDGVYDRLTVKRESSVLLVRASDC